MLFMYKMILSTTYLPLSLSQIEPISTFFASAFVRAGLINNAFDFVHKSVYHNSSDKQCSTATINFLLFCAMLITGWCLLKIY